MTRPVCYAILVLIMCSSTIRWAAADLVINIGEVVLLEDTPDQIIPISVSGGDLVQGLNFNLQVADAGPADGGVIVGPAITAVDFTGPGTVFGGNNSGQRDDPLNTPQLFISTTTTDSGAVAADGVLALVTFDTTGFFFGAGPFDLSLQDTLNGATDFAGLPATITDGRIIISAIPEASGAFFMLLATAASGFWRPQRAPRLGSVR